MTNVSRAARFYYRNRSAWWRRRRLIFPSPAELRLIELMGGKVVRIRPIRDLRTHFPAAIVVSMGPIFRAEKIRREVRFGAHFVDFANDINRIIEVDGAQWHMDVVADFDREIRIKEHTRKYAVPGQEARFLRLKAYQIINNPATTRARVRKFLLD